MTTTFMRRISLLLAVIVIAYPAAADAQSPDWTRKVRAGTYLFLTVGDGPQVEGDVRNCSRARIGTSLIGAAIGAAVGGLLDHTRKGRRTILAPAVQLTFTAGDRRSLAAHITW